MLMISIPKEAYCNAPAPSLSGLNERVKKMQILPEGMKVTFNMFTANNLQDGLKWELTVKSCIIPK